MRLVCYHCVFSRVSSLNIAARVRFRIALTDRNSFTQLPVAVPTHPKLYFPGMNKTKMVFFIDVVCFILSNGKPLATRWFVQALTFFLDLQNFNNMSMQELILGSISAAAIIIVGFLTGWFAGKKEKIQRDLDIIAELGKERIKEYRELWRMVEKVSSVSWETGSETIPIENIKAVQSKIGEWYADKGYHLDPQTREMLLDLRSKLRRASFNHKDSVPWEDEGQKIWRAKTLLRMAIAKSMWCPDLKNVKEFRKQQNTKLDREIEQINEEIEASKKSRKYSVPLN